MTIIVSAVLRIINSLIERLDLIIRNQKQEVSILGEESLSIRQYKDHVGFCSRIRRNGKYFEHGITKDKRKVCALARKRYALKELGDLEKIRRALVRAAEEIERIGKESSLGAEGEKLQEALKSVEAGTLDFQHSAAIREWYREGRHPNPFMVQNLRWVTKGGVKMRSKSEKVIGDAFEEMGILYKYDERVRMPNGKTYFADFVFLNLKGELCILEHFGLMDDEAYALKAFERVLSLLNSGVIKRENLILTFEKDVKHPEQIVAQIISVMV